MEYFNHFLTFSLLESSNPFMGGDSQTFALISGIGRLYSHWTLNSTTWTEDIVPSVGEIIPADHQYLCIGKPRSSAWLRDTSVKNDLDRDGGSRLMNITDVQEIQQGVYAQAHAQLMAKNLMLFVEGGKESKLGTYGVQPPLSIVSLGRKHGIAKFPFITVLGRVRGMIKSGDLFVGKLERNWDSKLMLRKLN